MTQTMARAPKHTSGITSDIGVKWEVAQITPSAAAAMLELNTHNRPMRTSTLVRKYASDMRAGNWKLTMDAIRFDDSGVLIDGQHRLAACVSADVSFTTLVIYGLPKDVGAAIDIGKPRVTHDILMLGGHVNTLQLAATIRWLFAIRTGVARPSDARPSEAELASVLRRHPKLPASVKNVFRVVKKVPSPALIGALHYIATHKLGLGDRVEEFVDVLDTGIPSYADDPAHQLREFVMKYRGTRSQLLPREYSLATIHVWNMFAARRPMKVLKLPNDALINGLDVETML